MQDFPFQELTYPTLGSSENHLQNTFGRGYVSSQGTHFHETCSHGHNVSQACEHCHTPMLQFHIAPTTKRQGVIRFGEPQGVPKTHWRLDAQLIFKGRGASVETIRRSKETILHLKKCLDLKHFTLGVNAFSRSSKNVKVDNSITVAYTAKPRCNIQISYEDKWQSTSMHVYVYFLLYTAANFTQTSLQTLVSFQVKKKKHVSYTSLFSRFNLQTLTMCLLQFTCINLT